jgi:hypothetical protein
MLTFPPFYWPKSLTMHLVLLQHLTQPYTAPQPCRRMSELSFANQIPEVGNSFQIYCLGASAMYFANRIGMCYHMSDMEQVTKQQWHCRSLL